jgi:hypothetical protein
MLPLAGSPRLAVVGREVHLGAGRADLVAVESSGRLVIVEVKLSGSPEARRAVVAQVLSYAAYLQGLDQEHLEVTTLGAHLRRRGFPDLLSTARADDPEQVIDDVAFRDGLALSLAEGRFRLVIVLDTVPDELAQLVGYLQSLTDRIIIDLITVSSYQVGDSRILVPQRVEPARRARELSDAEADARQANALSPGSGEFRAAAAQAPAEQQPFLHRLTQWAERLEADGLITLFTYRGKNDITTLLPRLPGSSGLATVYQEPRAAYLQLWPTAIARRAPSTAATIEAALGGSIKQGARIIDVSDQLLTALTDAYHEAAGRPRKT